MKLLVRNLAKATTEEKILSLFKEHGNVQSCNLVLDKETGQSKGFAFVEMPKVGEAKAAIKQLNGYKLAGNIIRVKKAEAKKNTDDASEIEKIIKPKAAKKVIKTDEKTTPMVDTTKVWGTVKD
ncbi:RNA-binding protein [Psychromonas sp. RZ22]|nr:RNA-binding protein [Psychromonas sp. RZ22]